jgi:hypothetical protein
MGEASTQTYHYVTRMQGLWQLETSTNCNARHHQLQQHVCPKVRESSVKVQLPSIKSAALSSGAMDDGPHPSVLDLDTPFQLTTSSTTMSAITDILPRVNVLGILKAGLSSTRALNARVQTFAHKTLGL